MDTTWVDDRFSLDSYKLAYFYFLLNVGGPLVVPGRNKGLVEEQVLDNDDFFETFSEHFVITKNFKDVISSSDMRQAFSDMSVRVFNGHIKRHGIVWDRNGKRDGNRGLYRGSDFVCVILWRHFGVMTTQNRILHSQKNRIE